MHHGWIDPNAGFPPRFAVAGGPLDGKGAETLIELSHLAGACDRGREAYAIWSASAEWAFFAAQREGIAPQLSIVPGAGVTRCELAPKVAIRSARPMLPDDALEALQNASAPDGLRAVEASIRTMERALGVDASGGIGASTTAALFGGRWMPKWAVWPDDAPPEWAELCHDAYHGGFQRCYETSSVATRGTAHPGMIFAGDPDEMEELPQGWRIIEVDRDSAYAEDAAGIMPDPLSEIVTDRDRLMDCAGGAIVDATVDLSGFTGEGFPVRVQVAQDASRCVPVTTGAWRGVWCSDAIRWAAESGARVEIHGGIGWTKGARFLAPMMDRLWAQKYAYAPGLERGVIKAAIQRAVGRLGRRHYSTVVLCGADATREAENPSQWPARWRRVHGFGSGYFVADAIELPPGLPKGTIPPWPAFVVSRAWIRLCRQIQAFRAGGARILYADTDGFLAAVPPGMVLPDEHRMGGWRAKKEHAAVEHRAERQFIRIDLDGSEHLQFAGVPRSMQWDRLAGIEREYRAPNSALIDLQAAFRQVVNRLSPAIESTREGVERAKRVGRNFAGRMDDDGF